MLNRRISLVFAVLGVTAFGWAVACSSTPSGGTSGSSGSGTSGSSGTASGSSGSSGSSGTASGTSGTAISGNASGANSGAGGTPVPVGDGGPCAMSGGQTQVPVVPASDLTIVNQSVPSGQIQLQLTGCAAQAGTYYTDVDGNESAATKASLMPPNGQFSYTAIAPPADAGVPGATFPAACVSASNIATLYGTGGLGFNFATTIATGDSGTAQTPIAVDISAHTGVTFWLWAPTDGGPPPTVEVKFSDKSSNPAGGECVVGASDMTQCYDDANNFPILVPGWNFVTIQFATSLSYGGFGNHGAMLDTHNAYGITWQVQDTVAPSPDGGTMGFPVSFDFCVADVSFF